MYNIGVGNNATESWNIPYAYGHIDFLAMSQHR